jgi:hypothetical protein
MLSRLGPAWGTFGAWRRGQPRTTPVSCGTFRLTVHLGERPWAALLQTPYRLCMQGVRPSSALPCPAGRSVPGRGGPERRRRPRPDRTGGSGTRWVHAAPAGGESNGHERSRAVARSRRSSCYPATTWQHWKRRARVRVSPTHQQGLVAARSFALPKGGQARSRHTLGPRGVSACSQSNRRHLASGRRVWCDLSLDVAGVGGGPVAKSVVGVAASPGVLRALSWVADEARRWLASRPLVHP